MEPFSDSSDVSESVFEDPWAKKSPNPKKDDQQNDNAGFVVLEDEGEEGEESEQEHHMVEEKKEEDLHALKAELLGSDEQEEDEEEKDLSIIEPKFKKPANLKPKETKLKTPRKKKLASRANLRNKLYEVDKLVGEFEKKSQTSKKFLAKLLVKE